MGQKRGKWEQLSSKVVHQNAYYRVRQDDVIKPDGSKGTYSVVEFRGAAFIVAVDDTLQLYLVGQHRYPIDKYSLEVPSGGLEDGEDPLVAAKRELQEEAGLQATTWKQLGITYAANGAVTGDDHMFLATGLSATADNAQAEEGIEEVRKVSFSEAFDMIHHGEIHDQQTITALTMAALELGVFKQ